MGTHAVQLYEREDFLCEAVSGFMAEALTAGQPLLVIATQPHRLAFTARLKAKGLDVDRHERTKQLTLVDAKEALAGFMIGKMPDDDLFLTRIGGLIDDSLRGRRRARLSTYGEMVDVLWQDGNPDAAIRLEQLWNTLAAKRSFSLLCAYSMANFHHESHAHQFDEVCHQHTHVLPAESYRSSDDEQTRTREISRLQQRSRALESEIEYRKELEHALCEALADRRRAHEALQTALTEAERANQLKDEFLALLSHELRTPLNAIVGWARLIASPNATNHTIHHGLEVVQRNANLQLHLINDLLDISRIVTGKMRMSRDRVELQAVLSAAVESIHPAATAKGIDLAWQLGRDACIVNGDADRLQQVIWNLLSNAIKFTPVRGRIELRLERLGPEARIVVQDSGQGIARHFLPHVFERFRQADTSTTRQHGGLGLGLAVVRHIVEAHSGTVAVDSPGEDLGATFTVSLPMCADEEVQATSESTTYRRSCALSA